MFFEFVSNSSLYLISSVGESWSIFTKISIFEFLIFEKGFRKLTFYLVPIVVAALMGGVICELFFLQLMYSMINTISKVKEFLIKQNLLKPGEKLAAAVSGGPDSVAMLFCLNDLKKDIGFELSVFHINHMLRSKESDRDESFVKNLTESLGLPFYFAKTDVAGYQKKHKCSVQVAAREMRYFHMNQLADRHSILKIATGHTADDQAETVLMRILKGSGLKGISGISPIRDNKYIRPMLEVTREEIEQFLKQNKIKFLMDSTNLKNHYHRNRVRNKLIPFLKEEFNPSIIDALCRSSQIFRADDNFISEVAQNELNKLLLKNHDKILILDATHFQTLHEALKRRIILDAIYQFSGSGRQVSQNIIENILHVIGSNVSGKSLSVFNNLIFKYQYNQIIFELQKKNLSGTLIKQKKLLIPGKTKIEEIGKEVVSTIITKKDVPKDLKKTASFTAFIDYSVTGKELFVRSRQRGDKFCPLGIKGHKKIKDYFIDKKVPWEKRDFIPLIMNKELIFWIAGYQISEFARIRENTNDVLKLEVY